MSQTALVLFSGGQDSATCLAWALEKFKRVETIGFDYHQRHKVELDCRTIFLSKLKSLKPNWCARLGEDHLIDLSLISNLGETALTKEMTIEVLANGLPNTFVPGRNLLFFVTAATVAFRRNISTLVGGMCETDYSGYPDCRDETIRALKQAISLGLDKNFDICTPLMWLAKAKTWDLANEIGGHDLIDLIICETHTCYKGERSIKHRWGFGCGTCPACKLRQSGFDQFISQKTKKYEK